MLHAVYFLSGVRDINQLDWREEYCGHTDVIDLPVSHTHMHTCTHVHALYDPVTSHCVYAGNV